MRVQSPSRIKLCDVPSISPGKCCLCNIASNDRQYIYFGLSEDFYGAFYFCTDCMGNVAEEIGYIKSGEYENLKKSNYELQEQLMDMKVKNGQLNNHLDYYRSLLYFSNSDDSIKSTTSELTEEGNRQLEMDFETEG